MHGLTEDLLNLMAREIEREWKSRKGNISYFVDKVRKTGLTPAALDNFLTEHGDTCHEGVNRVFSEIVYTDFLEKEGGEG